MSGNPSAQGGLASGDMKYFVGEDELDLEDLKASLNQGNKLLVKEAVKKVLHFYNIFYHNKYYCYYTIYI